jgi:hypothetical protein
LKSYGYCIIPKGTILFRGHADTSLRDCMFFATNLSGAASWNETIQVWKVLAPIQVLFAVEYVTDMTIGISAIPDIYNGIFSLERNPNFTDLDIKHWDLNRRDKFVRKLFDDYKLSGWFTSFENNTFNEVCLFDKHANSKQLKLIDITGRKDKNYYKDSLEKIKFFPSPTFYTKTLKELNKHATYPIDRIGTFRKHKRYVNTWIKEYLEQGMTKDEAKHEMISLRTQIKI